MNTAIFNRDDFQHPSDGWYQIEPKGEHPNRTAGVVQVIDDKAAQSIVNRFNAEAESPKFPGILVDHEHFKHDPSQETIAYGWLMKLQNRADGIYGQIRWTTTGKAAVDGGDYRFFSTEYSPSDLETLDSGNPKRVRPMALDGLSLTNAPNNKGGAPITNRQSTGQTDAARLSPSEAAAEFSRLVNRAQKLNGWSFRQAWDYCRTTKQPIFNRMAGAPVAKENAPAPVGKFQNRETKSACDRLRNMAEERQRNAGIPFADAWLQICRSFPDLNAKAFGRIVNRDSATPEGVTAGDWKKALASASDAATKIQSEATETPDRGETVSNIHALRGAFKRYLAQLQSDEGMTFQKAFDHIKDTEPVFWSRVVLDYANASE